MSYDERSGPDRDPDRMPDVDDERKPESPTQLSGRSWRYALRKTVREFGDDHCTDLAAGLTYYAVLSLFPAAIALISVLGVVGQGKNSVDKVMEVLQPLVSSTTLDTIRPALDSISTSPGAGLGLVIGLLGAL
jgi:membrane protein